MLTRRSFLQESLAFLASLGLAPELLAGERPEVELADPVTMPGCWLAQSEAVMVGPQPVTVLQLEGKTGRAACLLDVTVFRAVAGDAEVIEVSLERQSLRCSQSAVPLWADKSPAVFAWQEGPAAGPGDEKLWAVNMHPRSRFRWVASPQEGIALAASSFTGVVARAEVPTWVSAILIGRDQT